MYIKIPFKLFGTYGKIKIQNIEQMTESGTIFTNESNSNFLRELLPDKNLCKSKE